MQKKLFFLVFLLAFQQISMAQNTDFLPLYQRLRSAPVLVFATISDLQLDAERAETNAVLTITSVLKGKLKTGKLAVCFENESGDAMRYQVDIADGDKKVFVLKYDDETSKWCIDTRKLPYLLDVDTEENIYLSNEKMVTLDDFRKGFYLFNVKFAILTKKYEENDAKIKVENPTKNRTFAFLVAELKACIAEKLKKVVIEPIIEN